jgi:hypothetical protein
MEKHEEEIGRMACAARGKGGDNTPNPKTLALIPWVIHHRMLRSAGIFPWDDLVFRRMTRSVLKAYDDDP